MGRRDKGVDGQVTGAVAQHGGPVAFGGFEFHQPGVGFGSGVVEGGPLFQRGAFLIGFAEGPVHTGEQGLGGVGAGLVGIQARQFAERHLRRSPVRGLRSAARPRT